MVKADAVRDLLDVGAHQLADVRDLVDEADARHQERVGRELDHLRRRHVGAHDGRVELLVQRRDPVAVLGVERPDHDPVGVREVANSRPLGEELGVRRVADVLQSPGVERRAHLLAGPDRHGALHHDDRPSLELRKVVEDGPDRREVGVAGVGRRRPHADVEELGIAGRLVRIDRERESLPVPLDQLGQARLVERDPAGAQRVDLLRGDVADHDRVPELGEAGAGDESDPAGPEDPDLAHRRVFFGFLSPASGRRPRAIESIVSLESVSRSVFTTQ